MKKLFVGVLWVALSLSVQGKEVNMTSPDGKYPVCEIVLFHPRSSQVERRAMYLQYRTKF